MKAFSCDKRRVFYRFVRAVISFALGMFYRIKVERAPADLEGPIIFVGNHPNSIIDPALVFVITSRKVTFLAKEPLFRAPVFGWILRGLDALPVYRKTDHPGQTAKNEGTFDAACGALRDGRAITIFPEGKSHSEPQLAEIKTGCARIAFRSAKEGVPVRIVPIGLTYSEKQRFRSWVFIDVGAPIEVKPHLPVPGADEAEAVHKLTDVVADSMRGVTLNLEQWEDLPIIQTAEELYSLRLGEKTRDPERIRRFAKGLQILRDERPEVWARMREDLASFRRRLELVHADAKDLSLQYRRGEVYPFVFRNLAALLFGLPVFFLGCGVFFVPFMVARLTARIIKVQHDRIATLKFSTALVLGPIWWALISYAGFRIGGVGGAMCAFVGAVPFALWTRYFFERRRSALRDIVTFLVLGNRGRLKARLLVEGEKLSNEIEALAAELRPRVIAAEPTGT